MKNEKAICYESYLKMLSSASADLLEAYACRDGESAKYCQGYKTLAVVYPALANLAEELNLNYGAEIRFADGQDLEFTEKSEAFYDLSRQIQKTISQKKEFVNVPDLYDAFSDDIVSQLNTVSEILQNPDNGFCLRKINHRQGVLQRVYSGGEHLAENLFGVIPLTHRQHFSCRCLFAQSRRKTDFEIGKTRCPNAFAKANHCRRDCAGVLCQFLHSHFYSIFR